MEKVSKREEKNRDIISSLHESILIHILSFLKAKEAVQTCVISKRFRNLWAYLPSLNLDCNEFDCERIFERFVFSVLLLRRVSCLDSFRLKWSYDSEAGDPKDVRGMKTWLHYLLRFKPRVIFLDSSAYGQFGFPASFFCSDTLEELTVMLSHYTIMPGPINFPRLKILKFGYLTILEDVMKRVLSACPLLEELELFHCRLKMWNISSNTLKRLRIIDLGIYLVKHENGKEIIIHTPNLEYLRLEGKFLNGFKLKSMPSIVDASISVSRRGWLGSEMLDGISNVRQLSLFGPGLKCILEKELMSCPTLNNLNQLTLDESFKDAGFKWYFNKHSPNLESISFSYQAEEVEDDVEDYDDYDQEDEEEEEEGEEEEAEEDEEEEDEEEEEEEEEEQEQEQEEFIM